MNEALCDYCRPLFEGEVHNYQNWCDYQAWEIPKLPRPHHGSIRDLVECAQTRCVLCSVIWASASSPNKDKWSELVEPDNVSQSVSEITVAVNLGPDEGRRAFTITMDFSKGGGQVPRSRWDITFFGTLSYYYRLLNIHRYLICFIGYSSRTG
jgi:hypothetical protein